MMKSAGEILEAPEPEGAVDREWDDATRRRENTLRAFRENLPAVLSAAGVPKRYQNFTRSSWEEKWGAWEDSDLGQRILDWPDGDPDHWLVMFIGKFGRRKTGLATALFGEILCRGGGGRWEDASTWVDEMERGINEGNQSAIYLRAAEAPLLLLDDLGAVRGGRQKAGWWQERIAQLVRYRHVQILPTIITANFSTSGPGETLFPDALASIEPSLVSRMNVPMVFELSGPDQRYAK